MVTEEINWAEAGKQVLYWSAWMAQDEGKIEDAINLYERSADTWDAGKNESHIINAYARAAILAEEAGMVERAIGLFVKSSLFEKAGVMAEEAGMFDRAIEIYNIALEHPELDSGYRLFHRIPEPWLSSGFHGGAKKDYSKPEGWRKDEFWHKQIERVKNKKERGATL